MTATEKVMLDSISLMCYNEISWKKFGLVVLIKLGDKISQNCIKVTPFVGTE